MSAVGTKPCELFLALMHEGETPDGPFPAFEQIDRSTPQRARPRDVRGVGYPSSGKALLGGKTLNALSQKVEVPYPGTFDGYHPPITSKERKRVEEFIGCTLEQSYSEFTVELKNAIHRLWADVDGPTFARHRGGGMGRKRKARRVA